MTIHWTTACPDWKERIVRGETLIPFPPLFPHEAERALEVFKSLRAVDVQGQPTMGEICRQWVFDLVACIFGAYDDENGRQLIRYFLLLIAKKNGKSTLAAGIMITALVLNWRMSAELYILSPTKEIANNSFFPARDMVLTHDTLRQMLRIQENFRQITHRNTNSILKVIAADSETVGGKKTSYLLIDELWQFGASAGAAAMLREAMGGLASRPEGFVMAATTQGNSQPAGIFDEWLTKFREIRDGKRVDQRSLGLLYEFPEEMIKDESYKDTRNFYIVNPNLGVSVDEEYLFDQLFDAENATNKGQLINFYAKHLNVQVGMALRADSWAGALVWERGIETGLTLDAIIERSEVITIGIDGGGLDDLLGIAIIGREKGTKRWLGWAHALISDIGIERRKANIENYDQFETDGNLTKFTYRPPVEGQEDLNAENIRYVVDLVRRIHDLGLLAQVGVDAAGIGAIVDALADIGVTQDAEKLDGVRQGIALMGAIKTIEIKLADYSFRHDGSRLMKWCVENLRVVPTPTAMRVARDDAGFGKVDPVMALFNAAQLMSLNPAAGGSVYDRRGMIFV